jgi:hypothetical protein
MYPPQQPPYGPNTGGQNPYQQGPPGYPGTPQQPSGKMPGTAITVRVLMFIGGVTGLLFGGLVLLMGAAAGGDNAFAQGFAEGAQEAGGYIDPADVALAMVFFGVIALVYGIVSTALASFMGKRSPAVLWLIVVFQSLAALSLVFSVLGGGFLALVPMLFAIGMITLMVLPGTRAYYSPQPAGPYTAY